MFQVEGFLIFKNGDFEKNTFGIFKSKKAARVKICSEIQALREFYESVEVISSDSVYSAIIDKKVIYNFVIYKI